MKVTRTGKRREAAINSVKVLLTSASLAATLGGWAAISAANGSTLEVAAVGSTRADATATVQAWLDSRSTATTAAATSTPAATNSNTTTDNSTATTTTVAATATVAPTATAVPTQVVIQPNVRTRSSR